jgi:hypothetical protein
MEPITVTIAPARDHVRMLARSGPHEVLRAILGPVGASHPRAVPTLLEGLALWQQRRIAVVLCVDESSDGSALSLSDALRYGQESLLYDVGLAHQERRAVRRRGVGLGRGDFDDLREIAVLGVPR